MEIDSAVKVTPSLPRRLGLLQSTALNMSNMIGVGPFITIPLLMGAMNGGGPQAMLGWIVGLLIAIPDGMVWAELGAAMPGSGGSYVYLRDTYGRETWGRLMAFLFVWQIILSGPLEIGTGFIGLKQCLQYFFPAKSGAQMDLWLHGITIGLGVLAIVLLYRKIGSTRNPKYEGSRCRKMLAGKWFEKIEAYPNGSGEIFSSHLPPTDYGRSALPISDFGFKSSRLWRPNLKVGGLTSVSSYCSANRQ